MCPSSGHHYFLIILLLINYHQVSSSSNQEDDQISLDSFLPDAPLLVQQFYQTLEAGINHLVVSRDMHRAVRRLKRQTIIGDPSVSTLGAGAAEAVGSGGAGFGSLFQGDPLGGVNSLIGLGSLNGLNNVPDALGPVAPIL